MTITALPTPPSRNDPSNFATRADAFLGALPDFATEANALAAAVNADEIAADASATAAASSASAAASSASSASSSASAASSSASAASASASAAAASYDSFDDRYLGAKSSDPSVDNDGNALLTGALYWNTTVGEMRVYSGTVWVSSYLTTGAQTISGVKTFSSNPVLSGGTANGVLYLNGSKVATSGSALVFDGSNLGLGVTPSAWSTSGLIDFSGNGVVGGSAGVLSSNALWLGCNFYYGSGGYRYKTTDSAGLYVIGGTEHRWYTAPSGTAGNAITFSQVMTLDASGNLGIGTSSPDQKVHAYNTASNTWFRAQSGGDNSTGLYMTNSQRSWLWGVSGGGAGSMYLYDLTGSKQVMNIDTSGNLGLGVTPSAWGSGSKSMELPSGVALSSLAGYSIVYNNAYHNGSSYVYKANGTATSYQTGGGTHLWFTAPSGTAGNAITFSQVMTLDASGNLGIGTSSPDQKVHAYNTASNTWFRAQSGGDNSVGLYMTNSQRSWLWGVSGGGAGSIYLYDLTGSKEVLNIDSSGNLGLGVTPSATGGVYSGSAQRAFTVESANITSAAGYDAHYSMNAYRLNDGSWKYQGNGGDNSARLYTQDGGGHKWFNAVTGTAGNAISFTQALTLDALGNLLLGGTSAGASSAASLAIFNGTAPTGSVTNGIILYAEDVSSSSELKVRDEAGNVTTLSPHNFSLIPDGPSEDMAWAYYSEKGGKRINVDMLKLARMVEKLTGEKLVYES